MLFRSTHTNFKQEIKLNPRNYDIWFDYIRLEETNGNSERIREVFERAIGNVPPTEEKRFWRRYIYLWINYAIYEELEAQVWLIAIVSWVWNSLFFLIYQDIQRARDVYREAIKVIPHKSFSFAKLWILHAQFEVRQVSSSPHSMRGAAT